jgi:hypothetical protein
VGQGRPAVLFLPANTARQHVGISVGIGSNQRRKITQNQSVMLLGDCRPGAPSDHPPSPANVHFINKNRQSRIFGCAAVRPDFLVSGDIHGIAPVRTASILSIPSFAQFR